MMVSSTSLTFIHTFTNWIYFFKVINDTVKTITGHIEGKMVIHLTQVRIFGGNFYDVAYYCYKLNKYMKYIIKKIIMEKQTASDHEQRYLL